MKKDFFLLSRKVLNFYNWGFQSSIKEQCIKKQFESSLLWKKTFLNYITLISLGDNLSEQTKPQLRSTGFAALMMGGNQGVWAMCNSETRMNQHTLSPKKKKKSHYQQFLSFVTKLQKLWNAPVSDIRTVFLFPLFLQSGYTKDLK